LNNLSGEKGFTLVEVLIGLVILAIGILAIAGMQITSIRGSSFSNNLTQASVIAQERLEFLKSLPLTDASLNTGDYNDLPNVRVCTLPQPTIIYHADRNPNPNYVTITYTVSWIEKGMPHNVSFRTIKAR
jgi:prepilin-type N-terminal cleavage/methylation domain-containing protein